MQPSAASVVTTWLRLVDGVHGWTVLPRLAVWLCVPVLVATVAATASAALGPIATPENPMTRAAASSANSIGVLFGSLGMFSSWVAAFLALLISLTRRWRIRVVCWLWAIALVALAISFPTTAAAFRSWMVLQGVRMGS
jgi:hypothetical protein